MAMRTILVGPFSKDQKETFLRELQLKNIPHETESLHSEFVTLAKSDLPKVRLRLEQFGILVNESSPDGMEDGSAMDQQNKRDVFLKAKSEKKNFNRSLSTWFIVLGVLCLLVILYAI